MITFSLLVNDCCLFSNSLGFEVLPEIRLSYKNNIKLPLQIRKAESGKEGGRGRKGNMVSKGKLCHQEKLYLFIYFNENKLIFKLEFYD